MTVLSTLPNEILSLIAGHLDRPKDLSHLALSSRRLNSFVKLDGWKAFLRGRFALHGLDSDARNAVHGLTTLYRNWDRKGFIARYVEPTPHTTSLNTWEVEQWRGPRGQTIGYRPSIDSYEDTFGAWADRREVLAWSAGTQVVMRIQETGSKATKSAAERNNSDDASENPYMTDGFGHFNSWYSYKIPDSVEGRDDITALKLLRPHQTNSSHEAVAFVTASGRLSLMSMSAEHQFTQEQLYNTENRSVSSLAVSPADTPLLATTLGDDSLAIYPTNDHEAVSKEPLDYLSRVQPIVPGGRNGRLWSCNFIANDKVAVGLGPSYEPIQVYEVAPYGLSPYPLRTFSTESKYWKGVRTGWNPEHRTSVYPILPIQGPSEAGNVFLSGGYDGIIRLHDMRSPRGFETLFFDPTNDSPVYSLAAQGLERIVAGVSMHAMLKVFDLRFSGSHAYRTISLPTIKPAPSTAVGQDWTYNKIVNDTKGSASTTSGGWNVYLNPRYAPKRGAYRENYWRDRGGSPVYSLSIPSPTSLNIYAGLEGSVENLTFHSIADPRPDVLLSQNLTRFPDTGTIDIKSSYNPTGDSLNLGMYEQGSDEHLVMHLMVQDGVTTGVTRNKEKKDTARSRGFDERWRDVREESERWNHTVEPTEQRHQRYGGRGRGRGRGIPMRGGRGRGRGGY